MMEFVAKAQVETAEREKRVRELRRAMRLEYDGPNPTLPDVDPEPEPKDGEQDDDRMDVDPVGAQTITASPTAEEDVPLPNGTASSSSSTSHALAALVDSSSGKLAHATAHGTYTSSTSSSSAQTPSGPSPPVPLTTAQLLDELTRELIQFQERFGAGKEGQKLYRERSERERRTRGVVEAD